jgi:hypothetical protein
LNHVFSNRDSIFLALLSPYLQMLPIAMHTRGSCEVPK